MFNFRSNKTDDECLPPIKKHNLGEIVSIVKADTSNSPTAANTTSTLIEGKNSYLYFKNNQYNYN